MRGGRLWSLALIGVVAAALAPPGAADGPLGPSWPRCYYYPDGPEVASCEMDHIEPPSEKIQGAWQVAEGLATFLLEIAWGAKAAAEGEAQEARETETPTVGPLPAAGVPSPTLPEAQPPDPNFEPPSVPSAPAPPPILLPEIDLASPRDGHELEPEATGVASREDAGPGPMSLEQSGVLGLAPEAVERAAPPRRAVLPATRAIGLDALTAGPSEPRVAERPTLVLTTLALGASEPFFNWPGFVKDLLARHPVLAGAALVLPFLFLYRRMMRERLLDSERRRAALLHVTGNPGATAVEVARALGTTLNGALYHLRALARAGAINAREQGSRTRYFENHGRYTREEERALGAAAVAENARFLRAVAERPGLTQREAAIRLSLAKSTVSRRVGLLEADGLLSREGGALRLTPAGASVLARAVIQAGAEKGIVSRHRPQNHPPAEMTHSL